MDYSIYENSKMIPDQSGWQQMCYLMSNRKVDIYSFLDSKNIEIVTTQYSAKELVYQAYSPDLFSGHYDDVSTTASVNDEQNYVLSSTNGSLTHDDFDNDGYLLKVISVTTEEKTSQLSLWNSSATFQKLKRNKRSFADISNIYLARYLSETGENFFILLNDKNQIAQFKIEGYKYLRPSDILIWMERDNYIKNQKAVWCYEKIREHDSRWTKKDLSFRNLKIT